MENKLKSAEVCGWTDPIQVSAMPQLGKVRSSQEVQTINTSTPHSGRSIDPPNKNIGIKNHH